MNSETGEVEEGLVDVGKALFASSSEDEEDGEGLLGEQ